MMVHFYPRLCRSACLFFSFMLLGGFAPDLTAQVFYTEDFEDATVLYTPNPAECTDMGGDYFIRTDGSNIGGVYNNVQGSSFFAAADLDASGCPDFGGTATLTFSTIDITGQSDLMLSLFVAEDESGDGNEDWDAPSRFSVLVSIDGGTPTEVFRVEAEGGTNTVPRVDTDFDGTGDGTEITDVFTQYTLPISGTGTSMEVVLEFAGLDAGDEDIAVDMLEISGTTTTATCAITDFMITVEPACGDAPFEDDSFFEVSFMVSGGSGDYFLVNPDNSITYGREPSGPTDGLVTIPGGANSAATPGTTAPVQVVNSLGVCVSEVLMIDVPICPDCTEPEITQIIRDEDNICPGKTVGISITADLGDADEFVWYEGGCGVGMPIGTGTRILVAPETSTMYFVRPEGGCGDPWDLCRGIMITVDPAAVPDAPTTEDLLYCFRDGAFGPELTAMGEPGATFNWYFEDPATNDVDPIGSAPTPFLGDPRIVTFYVTQVVGGCESPAAPLTVTVRQLTDLEVVQTCEDAFSYELDVCFSGFNADPVAGTFIVTVNDTDFGPFNYADAATGTFAEYCVNIPMAGDPTDTETFDITVTDQEETDGLIVDLVDEILAATSFENDVTGEQYEDTGDPLVDHDLINNPGQQEIDTDNDMAFDAFYINTRDGDGLADGDFFGVTDFTGVVGAYTDGTQGYQFSDSDGKVILSGPEIDISNCETVEISVDIFVEATGWEDDDEIGIFIVYSDDQDDTELLNSAGSDIDDLNIEGSWMTLSATVSGSGTAQLVFEFDSNSGSEALYIDNISYSAMACGQDGAVAEQCSVTTEFTEEECFECPEIGMTAVDPAAVCLGDDAMFEISGLINFAEEMNLEMDFNVQLVEFLGGEPADAYEGGTVIADIPFGDLMPSGTDPDVLMASATTTPMTVGTVTVCAIINPTSDADMECMPQACTQLVVNPLPTIGAEANITVCDGGSTEITPTTGTILIPAQADDLIISQYLEGSSNNKCIEIFNGTGAAVDLSDYSIRVYNNGNDMPNSMTTLSGMLADGDVYVICNPNADMAVTDLADLLSGNATGFNGDDAIAIANNGVNVDVLGQIGVDPGSAWFGGGISTVNSTLTRKPGIFQGNDGTTMFDPSVEWTSTNTIDDVSGLGSHIFQPLEEEPATVYNFYGDMDLTDLLAEEVASFDPETTVDNSPQTIYVTAVNPETGCESEAVAVVIEVVACEIAITDPCDCNDDASPITFDAGTGIYTNPNDGTFGEVVAITGPAAAMLPAGFDFRVIAVTDAIGVVVGDVLTYDVFGNGHYTISFDHPDDVGYSITVGLFENDQQVGNDFMISNACAYPTPEFDPALDPIYCDFEPAITLGGTDDDDVNGPTSVTFTVDGNVAVAFDPTTLGEGVYEVVMTYTGADDGNGGIGAIGDPAYRGCTQDVVTTIVVEPVEISCISNVNVTLGDGCLHDVTPTQVIRGTFGCIDEFIIDIDNTGDSFVDGCGDHTYEIEAYVAGELVYECWGNIFAEDKTAPVIECPTRAGTGTADVPMTMQTISGELDNTDPTVVLTDYACFSDAFEPADGDRPYDLITFTVSGPDVYNIGVTSDDFDAYLAVFAGAFNPEQPCSNVLATNDDNYRGDGRLLQDTEIDRIFSFNPSRRLSLPLEPGQTYTLMVTNAADVPVAFGDWDVFFMSDMGNSVTGAGISNPQTRIVEKDLLCTDVDGIIFENIQSWVVNADGSLNVGASLAFFRNIAELNNFVDKLSYIGVPVATDNCGDILITVSDMLMESGDCGEISIMRTFRATDRYNNCSSSTGDARTDECSILIEFRRPTIRDIVLPPFTAPIECDESFATDGPVGGPDDNPAASVTGYPWIQTAFGNIDLAQAVCNVGANYSDEPRLDVCTGTYKFRREWNIIDWCQAGQSFEWDQYVKVGDFTGPDFTIPGITIKRGTVATPTTYVRSRYRLLRLTAWPTFVFQH